MASWSHYGSSCQQCFHGNSSLHQHSLPSSDKRSKGNIRSWSRSSPLNSRGEWHLQKYSWKMPLSITIIVICVNLIHEPFPPKTSCSLQLIRSSSASFFIYAFCSGALQIFEQCGSIKVGSGVTWSGVRVAIIVTSARLREPLPYEHAASPWWCCCGCQCKLLVLLLLSYFDFICLTAYRNGILIKKKMAHLSRWLCPRFALLNRSGTSSCCVRWVELFKKKRTTAFY